jgi:hypothetical protein
MHPNSGGEGLLIRDARHALRRNGNLVPTSSKGVREVQNMTFLAPDIRRKELGEQKEAH